MTPKGTEHAWRGRKDTITPETYCNKGTGTGHTSFRLFRSQRDAPSLPTKFSKAFQDTGFALQHERGRRSHHHFQDIIRVLQRLSTESHLGPPPRARRLSGRVPSRPHCPGVLEGAGPWKEAVTRTPWEPGYRASRVGEFKESEDWSPLLLLLR